MKTSNQKERIKNEQEMLHKFVPQGSTVYCVLRGVSRSGMSRNIDFYALYDGHDGQGPRPQWLTGFMDALGVVHQSRTDWEKSRGAKVHGYGMDMGFHVVDSLASALYGRDSRGLGNGLKSEWL